MITAAILEKQAEQNFLYAVKNKRIDALQLAMDQGLDPLRKINLNLTETYDGFEVLVNSGWLDGLKHLVGPECDFKTANKEKLLFLAIGSEEVDLCRFLVEQGADLNSANEEKRSPLNEALMSCGDDVCEVLLSKGVDVNAVDPSGYSPIQAAAHASNLSMARRLLELGADVNNKGKDGFTALHLASAAFDRKMCLLLLQAGADPKITNIHGKTALANVSKNLYRKMSTLPFEQASIFHVLVAHGANPMDCEPEARNTFDRVNHMTLRQVLTVARLSDQLVQVMENLPSMDPRDTLEQLINFSRMHVKIPGIVDEKTFDMLSFLECRQAGLAMKTVIEEHEVFTVRKANDGVESGDAPQETSPSSRPIGEVELLDRAEIARQAAATNMTKKTGSHP